MSIKFDRAKQYSKIGLHKQSFAAMWAHIPEALVMAMTSKQLAAMVDSLWSCAGESKKLAEDEAILNGFVWDHKNGVSVDLCV